MEKPKVIGTGFVVSYVDDFEPNFKFYSGVLGMEKSFEMTEQECFFRIGENKFGLLLCGGYKSRLNTGEFVQASYILKTESASAMHAHLKAHGAKIVQDAPVDMGENDFWFQFFDPAGNMLQMLGGK